MTSKQNFKPKWQINIVYRCFCFECPPKCHLVHVHRSGSPSDLYYITHRPVFWDDSKTRLECTRGRQWAPGLQWPEINLDDSPKGRMDLRLAFIYTRPTKTHTFMNHLGNYWLPAAINWLQRKKIFKLSYQNKSSSRIKLDMAWTDLYYKPSRLGL